jgi:hypothetical protein
MRAAQGRLVQDEVARHQRLAAEQLPALNPLGVQRFGEAESRTVTYIGIPALDGNTWPLQWYSEPTPTMPYVDPERLHAALGLLGT